jgi:tRNA modification GTPase
MSLLDTIFARATGPGRTAVSIVRVSGPDASEHLCRLAGKLPPARRASLRSLRHPQTGEVIDTGLVLWFPAPGSYTGEDLAEFQLHGGAAVFAAISDALLALGCRPAQPGEFTRRAFLQGRMDLLQAEGIADLVNAETEGQRRQALRQADGALSRLYEGWTRGVTAILAQQEAAIEFEMDDLPTDVAERAGVAARQLAAEISMHLDDGRRGERLRDGLSVAVIGAPNAGKSSLLNALVGRSAAIVSAQAGTTRDIVECRLDLGGVPATIADTAGLRDAADEVEREGVRRAMGRAREADLVLALFAADQPLPTETLAVLKDRPDALAVVSKSDLGEGAPALADLAPLRLSVATGAGLETLRAELTSRAGRLAALTEAPAVTRLRHRAALETAAEMLLAGADAVLPEVAAEAYRRTLGAMGELVGRVEVDAVLDAVFSEFCIGK